MTARNGTRATAQDVDGGGVIVAHPGTQHSARLAEVLRRAGILDRYLTSLVWRDRGRLARALTSRPGATWSAVLMRELGRRADADLGASACGMLPAGELLYVGASRLGARRASRILLSWRNDVFDRRVAAEVTRRRPRAVIGYDSAFLRTLRAARAVGSLSFLDQSIGHIKAGLALIREDAERWPDFADGSETRVSPRIVERCTREAVEADHVLAPSAYVRSTLVANDVPAERISVVPFGVDTDEFRPASCDLGRPFRVLYVGQLTLRKGLPYLLEAFRQLHLPRAELVLVGGTLPLARGFARYADLFTHVPNVPRREVCRQFQSADILVHPSLHEGSALATYEALACGIPVVTTPNAGSVVDDGVDGYVVPIRDVEALKGRILGLYEDRELRRAMSAEARRKALRFTWAAYGAGVLHVLENASVAPERDVLAPLASGAN
jgi:glycosyltransferase involved in cell wall biosynthesis